MKRAVGALAVASILVLAVPSPAYAVVAAAGPGSYAAGYVTRVVVVPVGGPLTFVNGDVVTHTLTADDAYLPRKVARKTARCSSYSLRRCPLFDSGSVGTGDAEEIEGLNRLKGGRQYAFYCQIHPSMTGILVAAGAGDTP
ncbi:MAG: hypothetical protein M3280_12990 [Actinomycetota bacterium]|nr:hypothetical protein [Actinomycetota bacterium]